MSAVFYIINCSTTKNMDKSDRLSTLINGVRSSLAANPMVSGHPEGEAWLFRDDVGAPHGIKGYEE